MAIPVDNWDSDSVSQLNQQIEKLTAEQRISWVFDQLPGNHVASSSFGIQAAVMLHMVSTIQPNVPVILIDTGYLFDETYRFIDDLSARLNLNIHVFNPIISGEIQELKFGKLWTQGKEGLDRYNQINKVEPMQRALKALGVETWIAGLRRTQSNTRAQLDWIQVQDSRYKVMPIVEWTNKDIHYYLKRHNLPYHPLWEQGYVSVGDYHTSMPLQAGMLEEQTRFFGLQRECGIHNNQDIAA